MLARSPAAHYRNTSVPRTADNVASEQLILRLCRCSNVYMRPGERYSYIQAAKLDKLDTAGAFPKLSRRRTSRLTGKGLLSGLVQLAAADDLCGGCDCACNQINFRGVTLKILTAMM